MTARTREEAPVEIEGGGVELRLSKPMRVSITYASGPGGSRPPGRPNSPGSVADSGQPT